MATYVYGQITYTNNGAQTKKLLIQFNAGVVKYYTHANFQSFTNVDGNNAAYNAVTYLPNTQPGLSLTSNNLAQLIANGITSDTISTNVSLEFWQIVTSANDAVQINRDLIATSFSGVNFSNVNFTNCRFNIGVANNSTFNNACNFTDANLTNVNLSNAVIASNLTRANLTSANLTSANLTSANLTSANLTSADLTSANLTNTNFFMVTLANAIITNVDFSSALNILSLTGLNVANGIPVTNTANAAKFPPYTSIIQTGGNKIAIQVPVTVDSGLASGALTSINSPSASIPEGPISINTTSTIIANAGIDGNIGRLIPLNVLKLARAAGCVINIQ